MKIFVSHSSKDKWAARRIAKDVEELGHTVFLDEKDIATGESITDSIQTHLKESDHLLLLLSPASLTSSWVLVELGGAMALGKKVIPILLYVGANEIPPAINLKLARDINDIGKYYEEIGGYPTPPKAASEATQTPPQKARPTPKFDIGAEVVIHTSKPEKVIRQIGPVTNFTPEMEQYLGQKAIVVGVDIDGDLKLDIDDQRFAWATPWLRAAPSGES